MRWTVCQEAAREETDRRNKKDGAGKTESSGLASIWLPSNNKLLLQNGLQNKFGREWYCYMARLNSDIEVRAG